MIKFLMLTMIAALVTFNAAKADEYKIPLVNKIPEIDGKIDPMWNDIASAGDFITKPGEKAIIQTSVKIAADNKNLYLLIICKEPTPDKLRKTMFRHDDPIYLDDCVEIFIASQYGDIEWRTQFVVSAAGATFERLGSDMGWNCDWKSATIINQDSFVVEMSVPRSAVQLQDRTVFGMSVGRERWVEGGKEFSYWPIGGSFNLPTGLAVIGASYQQYFAREITGWNEMFSSFKAFAAKHHDAREIQQLFAAAERMETERVAYAEGSQKADGTAVIKYITNMQALQQKIKVQKNTLIQKIGFDKIFRSAPGASYFLRTADEMNKLFGDSFLADWDKPGTGDNIGISGAKNESVSFQIAVIPSRDGSPLDWQISSATIPADKIQVCPVGYVNIDKNSGIIFPKNYSKYDQRTGLWPDPLYETVRTTAPLKSRQIQSLWVTVNIPHDAKSGEHDITIKVGEANVKVKLQVWNFSLPAALTLKAPFWIQDIFLKRYYPEFSKEQFEKVYESFYKKALEYRVTPIEFGLFDRLVEPAFDKQTGTYSFDFSGMKRYGDIIFGESDRMGNLMNLVQHSGGYGNWVPYNSKQHPYMMFRDDMPKESYAPFKSAEHENMLKQYLTAAVKFAKENNWLDQSYLGYIDEPTDSIYDKVRWMSPIMRKYAPELKSASAMAFPPAVPALDKDIDIMVPQLGTVFDNEKYYSELQKSGREVWLYSCYKTGCIDWDSLDHRVWGWYCQRYGFKGMLNWGLAYYDFDPINKHLYVNTPSKRWPNNNQKWTNELFSRQAPGDGYYLYPSPDGGAWGSIRLALIRDGFEDYEYFVILQKRIDELKKHNAPPEVIKQGEALLLIGADIIYDEFSYSRNYKLIIERRNAIGKFLTDYPVMEK